MGYNINYSEVFDICVNGVIGRRDIAKIMVEKGYFENENFAMQELFQKNKPYYIETKKNKIEDCIEVIKSSGGVAILAHPWTLNLSFSQLQTFLLQYKFDGIEVYNHNISINVFKELNHLADQLNLLKTCGTDFHGHKGLTEMLVNENVDCTKFLKKLKVVK